MTDRTDDDATFGDRVNAWFMTRVKRLGDPESMVAAVIMVVWAAALSLQTGSLLVVLLLLAVALTVHAVTIESASHAGLWVSTGLLLFFVVMVLTFSPVGTLPVAFAFGGASALAYQQLVCLNAIRRRQAVIDGRLIEANALAVLGCGVVGLLAAGVADAVNTTEERSWLWVPAAVACLLLLGFVVTVLPARWSSAASRLRYRPGERMPPRPRTLDPEVPPDRR
jgi:hypothetical protein